MAPFRPRYCFWAVLFRRSAILAALTLPLFLSGCTAALLGTILGVIALNDEDGGSEDLPPVITAFDDQAVSPDRILLSFRIENEDAGNLQARVEFTRVDPDSTPRGSPAAATPAPGSSPLGTLAAGEPVQYIWDARQDLADESALVSITVTPLEDGVPGEPFHSRPLRAGNTPVRLENLRLASEGSRVELIFDLMDQEADRVSLQDVEFAIESVPCDGDRLGPADPEFTAIPLDLIDRKDFPSSPSGERGTFGFTVLELNDPQLSAPGFVGEISFRISLSDFPGEEPTVGAARFCFDHNERPFVDILPVLPEDLSSGVIPIRYRVFDKDRNPFSVLVQVDLFDGQGLRPANEFPLSLSEGTAPCQGPSRENCVLDPASFGDPGQPFHTFLWDALSHPFSGDRVLISLRADDHEQGLQNSQVLVGLRLTPFAQKRDVLAGNASALVTADLDGDKVMDLALTNKFTDKVVFLRGSRLGLSQVGMAETTVGRFPTALSAGDFDGDHFSDLAVANFESKSVSFLAFSVEAGNIRWETKAELLDLPGRPDALETGDYDGDGELDLVVVNQDLDVDPPLFTLSYLRRDTAAGETFHAKRTDLVVAEPPKALTSADFDGDQLLDLVTANPFSLSVTYYRGDPVDGLSEERKREIPVWGSPVALATGDFNGDCFPDLVAANGESPDGSIPNRVTFLVARGPACGQAGDGLSADPTRALDIEVGDFPVAVASADFDGDGTLDLAVANQGAQGRAPGTVTYLRGRPGSGLTTDPEGRRDITVGLSPVDLATGDFDLDGNLDLIVANRLSPGTLSYLAGGGDGLSSERKRDIPVGDSPLVVRKGDFDGDGTPDLVVVNEVPDGVSYLRGGAGGPSEGRRRDIGVGKNPGAMVRGDFNGDGALDLVVANLGEGLPFGPADTVSYLAGGPEGLEQAGKIDLEVEKNPKALTSGDFNGDGLPDLAVVNLGSDTVSCLLGVRGAGLSGAKPGIPVGSLPSTVETGDFDGDGVLDLVVGNFGSNSLTCLWGKAAAGFSGDPNSTRTIDLGGSPNALLPGDFDGDGTTDLAVAVLGSSPSEEEPIGGPGKVNYLTGKNTPGDGLAGSEDRHRAIGVGVHPAALAAGDFNGDGFLDLAVSIRGSAPGNESEGEVGYFPGGASGLSELVGLEAGISPIALGGGDFNGDGLSDLVAVNEGPVSIQEPGTITYLRGGPEGLSAPAPELSAVNVGVSPVALATGDFDGDGALDLAVANRGPFEQNPSTVSFLRGGFGELSPSRKREIGVGELPNSLLTGDFDGDGALDLAVAAEGSGVVSYLSSRYLAAHVNCRVEPGGGAGAAAGPALDPCVFVDPRRPSRHRLELPGNALGQPAQVVLLPALVFGIPAGGAAAQDRFSTVVTGAVTVLPEGLDLLADGWLTLRLSDRAMELLEQIRLEPERLRVYRQDPATGVGVEVPANPQEVEFAADPGGSPALRFPIRRLGTYLVAFEEERP